MVVLAFFICWLPFHAQRLGYVYFLDTKWFRTANEYFTYLTGICYYVSSTINPIVYNVMSAKYRAAFRKTLCGIQPGNGLQNNLTLHKSAVGGDQSQLPRYGQVQRNRRATMPMTEDTSMQPQQPHNVMVLVLLFIRHCGLKVRQKSLIFDIAKSYKLHNIRQIH